MSSGGQKPLEQELREQRRRELACLRKQRERERKREGVVFVLSIAFYEDAIDERIARGDLTEDEIADRKRARTALEDLINHLLLKGN